MNSLSRANFCTSGLPRLMICCGSVVAWASFWVRLGVTIETTIAKIARMRIRAGISCESLTQSKADLARWELRTENFSLPPPPLHARQIVGKPLKARDL